MRRLPLAAAVLVLAVAAVAVLVLNKPPADQGWQVSFAHLAVVHRAPAFTTNATLPFPFGTEQAEAGFDGPLPAGATLVLSFRSSAGLTADLALAHVVADTDFSSSDAFPDGRTRLALCDSTAPRIRNSSGDLALAEVRVRQGAGECVFEVEVHETILHRYGNELTWSVRLPRPEGNPPRVLQFDAALREGPR